MSCLPRVKFRQILTQEQLAEKLGTYRETIARWETTGKSKPHHLYLEKLEKLLLESEEISHMKTRGA